MALRSISTQRRRLADDVYDQLVTAIMDREIGPNDRLVQEKLASELDISRTPVREALLRLEKEGVLAVANSGGFRLAKIT
ncbi:MAG: GntR family transcriptional regulator, partial [Pseudomonadota bacterium]